MPIAEIEKAMIRMNRMALTTASLFDRNRRQMSFPWLTGGAVGAWSSSGISS